MTRAWQGPTPPSSRLASASTAREGSTATLGARPLVALAPREPREVALPAVGWPMPAWTALLGNIQLRMGRRLASSAWRERLRRRSGQTTTTCARWDGVGVGNGGFLWALCLGKIRGKAFVFTAGY